MKRLGRTHRPFYRINVMDTHTPRDGRVIEELGHYDPIEPDETKQIVLKEDRIKYWLEKGATTSETVGDILKKRGIQVKN
ncbi:MAG: 30S ribosomal protein S16 [Phycisphaerae bacterium]|nr:30S ribosomal protein S16 [Phycisphaerae bacterium]